MGDGCPDKSWKKGITVFSSIFCIDNSVYIWSDIYHHIYCSANILLLLLGFVYLLCKTIYEIILESYMICSCKYNDPGIKKNQENENLEIFSAFISGVFQFLTFINRQGKEKGSSLQK